MESKEKRLFQTFQNVPEDFLEKLKSWASTHVHCCILDHNSKANYTYPTQKEFDLLIAVNAINSINTTKNSLATLQEFHDTTRDWLFGYLSYDLKNEIENLKSQNQSGFDIPSLHFFQPEYLFFVKGDVIELASTKPVDLNKLVKEIGQNQHTNIENNSVSIQPRITHADYIKAVLGLKHHIQVGDIYEVNFCQEFYAEKAEIQAYQTYRTLQQKSPTPFSCYFRKNSLHVLSSSPERYIKKKGQHILSQPIKGTAKRGLTQKEDDLIKRELAEDIKEQAENVMIVDLVRNDLSKTAEKGSVKVNDLFGIYSFPQVHQMISSVHSKVNEKTPFSQIIETTFPMGSMTGAPKIMAMKLIEEFESTKRGLYSGSIGYITPNGDFDFNVIIRSILYDDLRKFLSFSVGGAITNLCDPEQEYQESLLKAKAMFEVFDTSS